jgi:hypothetical protein
MGLIYLTFTYKRNIKAHFAVQMDNTFPAASHCQQY